MSGERQTLGVVIGLALASALTSRGAFAAELPAPPAVRAGPVRATHALVVGSNRPGRGQKPLAYAENDAQRFASLLVELGRLSPDHVTVLRSPGRAELVRALDEIGARISAATRAGEQSELVFYYSGHARAQGLSLGLEDLDLGELRERITDLGATLTIVLLDACQSGAFSAGKGAEAVAEFSSNSVARLNVSGLAVIASSTGNELSQESPELESSYFTHHLLVGMRGAADANRDGEVALDEAYRYAYHATLAATAATALGTQHPTLEQDLRGKGDVPLTFPAAASTQLALARRLAGSVLLQARAGGAVVAEIEKAAGEPMLVALPPGSYVALLRRGGVVDSCPLVLRAEQTTPFDGTGCSRVAATAARGKGRDGGAADLAVEVAYGPRRVGGDRYVSRLESFGFNEQGGAGRYLGFGLFVRVLPQLGVLLRVDRPDGASYSRTVTTGAASIGVQTFAWSTWVVAAHVRAQLPLLRERLLPYVQGGVGLGVGATEFKAQDGTTTQRFYGFAASLATGVTYMPWHNVGVFAELSWDRAAVIRNLLGDVHDGAAVVGAVGLRLAVDRPF